MLYHETMLYYVYQARNDTQSENQAWKLKLSELEDRK